MTSLVFSPLPKHTLSKQLSPLFNVHLQLTDPTLPPLTLKKNPQKNIATLIPPPDLIDRIEAASEGWTVKNKQVTCRRYEEKVREVKPFVPKDNDTPPNIRIANQSVPLWQVDYEKQVADKKGNMQKILFKVQRELQKAHAQNEANRIKNEKDQQMEQSKNAEQTATGEVLITDIDDSSKPVLKSEQQSPDAPSKTDTKESEEVILEQGHANVAEEPAQIPVEETTATEEHVKDKEGSNGTENPLKRPLSEQAKSSNDQRWPQKKKADKPKPRIFVPKISTIVPSIQINGYRTKMEFAIGLSSQGEPTCGFVSASFGNSPSIEFPGVECRQVSEFARQTASDVQDSVRASSFAVYDRSTQTGVWRLAVLRTSQNEKEHMLIIQAKSDVDKDAFESFVRSQNFKMNVLAIQYYDNCSDGFFSTCPLVYLTEQTSIEERICDLSFQISPFSFFQVNPSTAEAMYKMIGDMASASKPDCILDLCCGTGTIALTLAKQGLSNIIGVELIEEAVVDAKQNALNNNVHVDFHAGRVEDVVPSLTLGGKNCVAILDPPRCGVGSSLSRAIREEEYIRKVIYVSCNPKAALSNFVELCRPLSKRYIGSPFVMQKAVVFDMFPHTDHCELLIEFVRVEDFVEPPYISIPVSSEATQLNEPEIVDSPTDVQDKEVQ